MFWLERTSERHLGTILSVNSEGLSMSDYQSSCINIYAFAHQKHQVLLHFVHIHRGSVDHPKKQAIYFARSLGCWFAMLLWMEHPCNRKPPISSTIFVTLAGETPVCVLLLGSLPWHSPWKFTGTQKERIVCQPSFFRGYVKLRGCIYKPMQGFVHQWCHHSDHGDWWS